MKQVPPLALTGLLLLQLVMPVPILKGPVTDTAGLPKVNDAAVLLVRVIWARLLVVPTGCGGECLPADNSINTGPSEIILDKSPRLCHREMDASPQSRWLLGSGEGTRTESRVPAAAIGARTGGERALAEATGTSPARE